MEERHSDGSELLKRSYEGSEGGGGAEEGVCVEYLGVNLIRYDAFTKLVWKNRRTRWPNTGPFDDSRD